MAYQADIRISVKGAKQLDALSKAADKLVPQINAANAAFIRLGEIQQKNLPLIANFSRVLRENQKAFASTILSNKEATTAARNQALAEKELNNELARRNAVLNKARGIKSDPIAKSIARNRAKFSDANAPAFENVRDLPSGSKRPSRFAQFSQDVTKTSVEKKIQADLKNEKRLAKDIADIRCRSARRVEASNKRRVTSEKKVKKIVEESRKEQARIEKIRSRDSVRRKRELLDRPGVRIRRGLTGRSPAARESRQQGISSALIGGAFPLLFGQGPLAAAGGAIGGGLGGLMGGQFGFALSLVGTQIGSLISNLVTSAGELGKALGPFTQNTQAVTTALGLQGSAEEARIQLIEELKGKTAAFNAAMQAMSATIGQKGVDALKKFGDNTRLLGSEFSIAITKLQSFAAAFTNFIIKITGLEDSLKQSEATRTVKIAAAGGNEEAKALVKRREALSEIRGQGGQDIKKKRLKREIEADERIFTIRQKIGVTADQITLSTTKLIEEKRKELELENSIADKIANGTNKELARSISLVEQEFDTTTKKLEAKKQEIQQAFLAARADEKAVDDRIRLKEELKQITSELIEHNDAKTEAIELVEKLFEKTSNLKSNFEIIGESIASGVTDNITAAIQGTKSLGDAAKSILNDLSSSLIKLGVNTLLSKIPGFGGLPILGGRSKGGPVTKNGSFVVGEKGPELFVPKRSGTIIPNDKLAGGGSTNISVNIDASGSSVQGNEQQGKELGRVISAAIQSELIKQRRPGGLLR